MTNKITMIELFSGIGAQERALRQLNLPYEVINTCDCDKDAVLSYAAMRNDFKKELAEFDFPSQDKMIEELQAKNIGYDFQKSKHTITSRTSINKLKQYYLADKLSHNLGDISKVERLPYADLYTYSYPCTDLSVAGKGEGMVIKCDKCEHTWPIDFEHPENNNACPKCGNIDIASTRSGLLGQVQRLLTVSYEDGTLPKYLLLENVKNLVGKKFKVQFDAWVNWLDLIGYNTYYKVLNAKHYGIPQNRERIFAISIRKDVDTNGFTFPEAIPLTTRLKDVLEKNVDEKYYLPDDRIDKILNSTFIQEKKRIQLTDVCDTLLARDWKDPKCVPVKEEPEVHQLMNIMPTKTRDNPNQGRVYDVNGIAPTLTKMDGGNREPMVIDEIKIVGNYMPSNHDASRVVDIEGIAPTVKENHGTVTAIAEPHIIKAGQLECSFDQSGRVYDPEGISPTIMSNSHGKTSGGYTSPKIVVSEPQIIKVGQVSSEGSQSGMVYAPEGIAPTLIAGCHGYAMGNILEEQEPFIVASRGRNPDNPSDRTTGAPTEQRLEPNFSGCTNTLTSVQKDNYVAEPIVYDDYNSRISSDQDAINTLTTNCGASAERNGVKIIEPIVCEERRDEGIRLFKDDCVGTLRTIDACGDKRVLEPQKNEFPKIRWRIRKLTPKCCWRLMNFTDKDCDRAAKYVSPSAQYKQAGNSIVVAVLIALMSSLFIEDGHKAEEWTKYTLNFND